MTLLHDVLLSLAMHIPAALANRLIRLRFPDVTQRSAGSLLFDPSGAEHLFLDVRGSTFKQVCEQVATFRGHRAPGLVVVVCEIGYRSSQVAAQLASAGFENVVNLEGGMRALRRLHDGVNHYVAHRTG